MLESGTDTTYARAVPQLTQDFSAASCRVLAAEAALRAGGASDAAAAVRRLQEAERRKLQATVAAHALRKAHATGALPWQAAQELGVGGATAHFLLSVDSLRPQQFSLGRRPQRLFSPSICSRASIGLFHACLIRLPIQALKLTGGQSRHFVDDRVERPWRVRAGSSLTTCRDRALSSSRERT